MRIIALFIILVVSAGSSYAQGGIVRGKEMSHANWGVNWVRDAQANIRARCDADPHSKACYLVLGVLSELVANIRARQQWVQGKCEPGSTRAPCQAAIRHQMDVVHNIRQEYKEVGTKWEK